MATESQEKCQSPLCYLPRSCRACVRPYWGRFYFFLPTTCMNRHEADEGGGDEIRISAPANVLGQREFMATMDLLKQNGAKVRLDIANRLG